jgi:hypothetical protein
MASPAVEELLAYVRTGLKVLGLKTYIELDIVHQRGCPWSLCRSGSDELQLWCHSQAVLDEVVAVIRNWGHTVERAVQADTVLITPAN